MPQFHKHNRVYSSYERATWTRGGTHTGILAGHSGIFGSGKQFKVTNSLICAESPGQTHECVMMMD